MSVFNCSTSEFEEPFEFTVNTETNNQDTGELSVTDSLTIMGDQGVSAAVEDGAVKISIDPETFPEELTGNGAESFILNLSEDETKITNATWTDIGAALYSGKVLELRYKKGLKSYRSCQYLYTPEDRANGINNTECLFFVPYATYGNGLTFPGIKVIKITFNGVSVATKVFDNVYL